MRNTKPIMNSGCDITLWRLLASVLLFLSILRGIRFPNIWSYSHFLFNYDFGFTKRGFIGALFSHLNNHYPISYECFLIVSIVICSINIILLSILIRDFIRSAEPALLGCSLIYASSLAVVFLSHSIGYCDHVGLLFALVTLNITGFYKKLLFSLPSMAVALLVHEAIIVVFFPIVFMSLLFSIESEERIRKLLLLGLFSAALLALGLFVSASTLETSEAHKMYNSLQASIEHPLRQTAFDVLHRTSKDTLDIMKEMWSHKRRYIDLLRSCVVTGPAFLVFIYFSTSILRKSKTKAYFVLLSILASLSPLLLHNVGWDMHRWNTLAVTTSFLMLHIAYRRRCTTEPIATSGNIYLVCVFVIFVNGMSSISLFDGYDVKEFPFNEHQRYVYGVINGTEIFPYVPPR
ncbi:MAG TPA: hypothetical protein VMZ31_13520 [Phycisphaerae bacterium]|nr:hypothetical protein [Phycisphaerae bacterium]